MQVSFTLPALKRALRLLPASPSDAKVRVIAVAGQLCVENDHGAAGIEALVLTRGSFRVNRQRFAHLLRGFGRKGQLTLSATPKGITLGTLQLRGPVEEFNSDPPLPESFTPPSYPLQATPEVPP